MGTILVVLVAVFLIGMLLGMFFKVYILLEMTVGMIFVIVAVGLARKIPGLELAIACVVAVVTLETGYFSMLFLDNHLEGFRQRCLRYWGE